MKKSRLVLIGNGMAGVRALEELLKIAPDLYDISVFGAEPHPNYNRILLSPVLAVAGNGGIKTEVADFFTKLITAEEVLEFTGTFCQLYREEGWYLEHTVHYVNRVGLDYVKKKILEDHEGRQALWAKLQFSLDGEPDPWFEFDKARVDTRQFNPVAEIGAV